MAKRAPRTTTRKRGAAPARGNGGQPEPAAPPAPSEDDIRLRAYHRYLERGGGPGEDLHDWIEAERELRGARHN